MEHQRVGRLIRMASEIKTNPEQEPSALITALGVSKPQFYKDKRALEKVGFSFRYDRTQRRFVIDRDPYIPIYDLTLTETFALVMAVRLSYDSRTDTLSVILKDDAVVAESDEDKPGMVLDYDQEGNLISLEIPIARKTVETSLLLRRRLKRFDRDLTGQQATQLKRTFLPEKRHAIENALRW